MLKHTGAAIAVAAVLTVTPASAQELKKLKFTLSFTIEASAAPYIYAKQAGLFRKAGFDVTIDPSSGSGDALSRVASGTYDMGMGDVTPLIQFAATNPDAAPRAVYIAQDSAQYAIMAFKKYGIEKPMDLAGKSVGGATGEATMTVFPIFAKKIGLDLSTVEIKRGEVRLRETLFLRGEYQAVVGYDSTMWFNVKAQGVKREDVSIMSYGDYGLVLYGTSIIASRDFLRRDPEGVRRLVAALNEAWMDTIKDRRRSAASLTSADPMIRVDLEKDRVDMNIDDHVATPGAKKAGLATVDPARLQAQIDTVVEAFNLPRKPSIDDIYTGEFLPPLSARMLQ